MSNRLYLGDAFGWEIEWTAKVAISQLREESIISTDKCPKAQLIKNESLRWQPNLLKVLGYLPIINVVAGAVAIYQAEEGREYRPHHKQMWMGRGVAMVFTGPLLVMVDLIKFLFDCRIAAKYHREKESLIHQFNTSHGHSPAYWPGHPISCLK